MNLVHPVTTGLQEPRIGAERNSHHDSVHVRRVRARQAAGPRERRVLWPVRVPGVRTGPLMIFRDLLQPASQCCKTRLG